MLDDEKRKFLFCLAFFCANAVLSAYYLDVWPTPNPVSRALPVLAFSQGRTLQIDRYADETIDKSKVGEHYYSDKAPLPTLLMIPIYECMKLAGLDRVNERAGKNFPVYIWRPNGLDDGRELTFTEIIPVLVAGSFLVGALPFAGILLLSYFSLNKSKSGVSPILLVMFSFYGSFLFVYSGTFFGHVFAGFLLLLSYIKLKHEGYFLSGLLLGWSFLSEYTIFIAVPVWLALIVVKHKSWQHALRFALGVSPSILAILIYNWRIAGSPFTALNAYHAHDTYHNLSRFYGLSFPSTDALWGLSFSGAMGLFIFAPVLAIAAFFLIKRLVMEKSAIGELRTDYLTWFSILFFLSIASFFTWWGGWSYGPRYLIPMAVVLIYEGLRLISKHALSRIVFFVITGYGLVSAWLAKATLAYMVPDHFLRRADLSNTFTDIIWPEVRAGRYNSNNLLSDLFQVSPAASGYIWMALFLCCAFGFAAWHRRAWVESVGGKTPLNGKTGKMKSKGTRQRSIPDRHG
jgi:hypothetical protein